MRVSSSETSAFQKSLHVWEEQEIRWCKVRRIWWVRKNFIAAGSRFHLSYTWVVDRSIILKQADTFSQYTASLGFDSFPHNPTISSWLGSIWNWSHFHRGWTTLELTMPVFDNIIRWGILSIPIFHLIKVSFDVWPFKNKNLITALQTQQPPFSHLTLLYDVCQQKQWIFLKYDISLDIWGHARYHMWNFNFFR